MRYGQVTENGLGRRGLGGVPARHVRDPGRYLTGTVDSGATRRGSFCLHSDRYRRHTPSFTSGPKALFVFSAAQMFSSIGEGEVGHEITRTSYNVSQKCSSGSSRGFHANCPPPLL